VLGALAAVGATGVLAAAGALAGCDLRKPAAGPGPTAPRAGREIESPEDLLPSNLDLLGRLDLAKFRTRSGEAALVPFNRLLGRDGDETSLLALLRARSTVIWAGLRGIPSEGRLDGILVAQGSFLGFDPTASGGGWRRVEGRRPEQVIHERTATGTGDAAGLGRGDPSLLVQLPRGVLALATPVAAVGLRRILDSGPDPAHLDPPADALLGLVARPRGVAAAVRGRYPNLASLLDDCVSLRGALDLEAQGLRLDLAMELRSEAGAARLEKVLRAWLGEVRAGREGTLLQEMGASSALLRDGPLSLKLRLRASAEQSARWAEALRGEGMLGSTRRARGCSHGGRAWYSNRDHPSWRR
jgi:hypothetical protein